MYQQSKVERNATQCSCNAEIAVWDVHWFEYNSFITCVVRGLICEREPNDPLQK